MSDFGDTEPEDAWDANDGTDDLTRLLFRMVSILDSGPTFPVRNMDRLDEVILRLERELERRGADIPPRVAVRVGHIREGVVHLRSRDDG